MNDVLPKILGIALGICVIITGIIVLIFIFTHPVVFFGLVFIFSLAYYIYYMGEYFNE